MGISDEELIENIRGGDADSFSVIVDRYKVLIYNLMYRYSSSADDAADMTQEVFFRIFEKSGKYKRQKKKSFFAWMYTLALNYGRDWARKKKNSERCIDRLSREYANNDAQSPGRIVEADQEAEGLNLALSMLTGDRREMVLLKYRHERSIKEIAEVFDLSESAVKMRLQRALGELGETLKRQRSGAKNR